MFRWKLWNRCRHNIFLATPSRWVCGGKISITGGDRDSSGDDVDGLPKSDDCGSLADGMLAPSRPSSKGIEGATCTHRCLVSRMLRELRFPKAIPRAARKSRRDVLPGVQHGGQGVGSES